MAQAPLYPPFGQSAPTGAGAFGIGAGIGSAGPPTSGDRRSLLRVVSPEDVTSWQAKQADAKANRETKALEEANLSHYVRGRWEEFRNHRNTSGSADRLSERLLRAQRMFNGEYDPTKLSAIQEFGGSEVYARVVAVKSRAATALLRDVYLSAARPWSIEPEADPEVPTSVLDSIVDLIGVEMQTLMQSGQQPEPEMAHKRYMDLSMAATEAARRRAMDQATTAENKLEEILREGGFYSAVAAFLIDLPIFPYAVLKGPIIRMVPKLTWVGGKPIMRSVARMFWSRVSPFDIYWSPGASEIGDAEIIERLRFTRTDLNDLIGLPGYNEEAVRGALDLYGSGLRDWMDSDDTQRAMAENREDPNLNASGTIDAIAYTGNIQGQMLLDEGVSPKLVADPDRDYQVQTWIVGQFVLKTQINPSPRKRHPYFITSYEKVPGTVAGHSLADILEDIQEAMNATLRSLVNNLAISSGPQVMVDTNALADGEDGTSMYPWKRWHMARDPMAPAGYRPLEFFQPNSNAAELLTVYEKLNQIADEVSALPRYTTGSERLGGAGRTASGLGMLMGNASKVLENVAANIDIDVLEPALTELYDMVMLTDKTGMLKGQENITILGVEMAKKRESDQQKRLQFLQMTANPIDMDIIGKIGRARVLRPIAEDLGLPDDVVPDDRTLQDQQKAERQAQMLMAAAGVQQGQQPGQQPGQEPGQKGAPSVAGPGGGEPKTANPAAVQSPPVSDKGPGGMSAGGPQMSNAASGPRNDFQQGAAA